MTDQDINEQFQFPWQLTCKLACEAMIYGRTFEQQVNFGINHGMVRHEEMRSRYVLMKKANKAHAARPHKFVVIDHTPQ